MSENKLSVERIKHLLERAKICEQGDVEDVCDTALQLYSDLTALRATNEELKAKNEWWILEQKSLFTEYEKVKAENDRLLRYERAWMAINRIESNDEKFILNLAYRLNIIETEYGIPQDEKKEEGE